MIKFKKPKIAIATTVSNWELYRQTSKSFPKNIELFAIDGTKGFYGLRSLVFAINKVKKLGFQWLIMVDDDVVFKNPEKVFDLVEYMQLNNYAVGGMRDGGTLRWRNKNPIVVNPYFCILNLSEVNTTPRIKQIKQHQYINENEFRLDHYALHYKNYDINSLFEHYYCFFFWLKRNNNSFLYLDAKVPFKNETTLLLTHKEEEFLYHAWYSRFYNQDLYHTNRINEVLKFVDSATPNRQFTLLKNPVFNIKHFFYRNIQQILRKHN